MNKIYTFIITFSCFFFLSSFTLPQKKNTLNFIENKGQWEDFIRFKANIGGGSYYLEDGRLTFFLIDPAYSSLEHTHEKKKFNEPVGCHSYRMNFVNPAKNRFYSTKYKQPEIQNYFLGDKTHWTSGVGLYKEVIYNNVFERIDFRTYGLDATIKYDFIVHPYGNASDIVIEYEGVNDIFIKNKKLHIVTSVTEVVEQEPIAYQIIDGLKIRVMCEFILENKKIHFEFPNGYNTDFELVIDPEIIFASYSGSTSDNWGFTATYDANGHLYGAGASFDTGYPVSIGAFQTVFGGARTDIAISKFSPHGDQLIYTTYLGGGSTEIPHSLIVNTAGQLIVLGTTSSADYPTTENTYDNTYNGGTNITISNNINFPNGSDIVLSVFSESGANLIGSTFVGGGDNDGLNVFGLNEMNYGDDSRGEVFLDNENNIYFGSVTNSTDFPTTSGVLSTSHNGGKDGCLVKMSFDLSSMLWGTLLGGEKDDAIFSLRIDDKQNLFACGYTKSTDFPITNDALNPTYLGGVSDGFIVKVSPNGTQLLASSYLGTSVTDRAYFLDFDSDQQVYVTGQSEGGIYPVTDDVYTNPGSGQFIHKLNNQLSVTLFSTVFGNGEAGRELSPSAFMVDACDRIYLSGWGWSIHDMPLSDDALQPTTDNRDFYFIVFDKNATDLAYATYFGGTQAREHVDGGTSRFDKSGTIYQAVCAGCQGYSDFPTTPGAYSNTNNAENCNLGVIKFDFEQPIIVANGLPTSGCVPLEVSFSNLSKGASTYYWDFDDNNASSTETNPTHTFTESGIYNVKLIAYSNITCNSEDTAILKISVLENDKSNLTNLEICKDIDIALTPTFAIPGAGYVWHDGSTQFAFNAQSSGVYTVETTLANCVYVDSFLVSENAFGGSSFEPTGFCPGESVSLSANTENVDYYEWNDGLNAPLRVVDKIGSYWVRSYRTSCVHIDSFDVLAYENYSHSESFILCEGDTLFWGGVNYMSDTLTQSEFSSTHGCDSLVILNVIVSYPASDTFNVMLCKNTPYELWDGTKVDIEGSYTKYDFTVAGCDSTNTVTLSYFPTPEFLDIVEEEITVNLGYSAFLHISTNSLADSLQWLPVTYLDCDSCLTVEVTPFQTTEYFVIANDLFGCKMMDSVLVSVDATRNVYIPNAFSPNSDGENDLFQVYTDKGVKRINFLKIYDRWGNLVYQRNSQLPNDSALGWDGTYQGKLMDPAVFVYVAEVLFLNDDVRLFSGDVTLVR